MCTGIYLLPKVFLNHVGNSTKLSVPVDNHPDLFNGRYIIISCLNTSWKEKWAFLVWQHHRLYNVMPNIHLNGGCSQEAIVNAAAFGVWKKAKHFLWWEYPLGSLEGEETEPVFLGVCIILYGIWIAIRKFVTLTHSCPDLLYYFKRVTSLSCMPFFFMPCMSCLL